MTVQLIQEFLHDSREFVWFFYVRVVAALRNDYCARAWKGIPVQNSAFYGHYLIFLPPDNQRGGRYPLENPTERWIEHVWFPEVTCRRFLVLRLSIPRFPGRFCLE